MAPTSRNNHDLSTGAVLVRHAMTPSPFALSADADLAQLHDLMDAKRIRHVPVADNEHRLVGIVSHRDLVRGALRGDSPLALSERRQDLRRTQIREIMVTTPLTAGPNDTLRSAGRIIYDNKIGCLPVLENDKLVGILTESDFVRYTIDRLTE